MKKVPQQVQITPQNEELFKSILQAAESGNLEKLERIFEQKNVASLLDRTILSEAFYKCCCNYKTLSEHYNCLNLLLRKKADINWRHPITGMTPLMVTCKKGFLDLVRFLIDAGGNVSKVDIKNKKNALYYAIDVNTEKLDIVTMILETTKCRVNDVANDGSTTLSTALQRGHHQTVKALLKEGAKTNHILPNGQKVFDLFKKQKMSHLLQFQNFISSDSEQGSPDIKPKNYGEVNRNNEQSNRNNEHHGKRNYNSSTNYDPYNEVLNSNNFNNDRGGHKYGKNTETRNSGKSDKKGINYKDFQQLTKDNIFEFYSSYNINKEETHTKDYDQAKYSNRSKDYETKYKHRNEKDRNEKDRNEKDRHEKDRNEKGEYKNIKSSTRKND